MANFRVNSYNFVFVFFLSIGFLNAKVPGKLSFQTDNSAPELAQNWQEATHYQMLENQAEEQIKKFLLALLPEFNTPTQPQEWHNKVTELRKIVLEKVYLRGYPAKILTLKPEIVWGQVLTPDPDYVIRKLRYEIYPGYWIPALLYEPTKLDGKMPVVLNANGHHDGGKAIEYKQARCINLAKRGMLAFNFEFIGMGELQADRSHNNMAQLNVTGFSGIGLFYLAMKKGLDILLDHDHADHQRVAMTGLSGGGWQTIVLSALDARITAAIPVAGYTSLRSRVNHYSDIGDLEQVPVDLATILDYQELTAMLAPRPALLILNDKDDCCFQTAHTRPVIYDAVVPTYRAFAAFDNFETYNNVEPGTHNYEADNRSQLYRFLNKHFGLNTPLTDMHKQEEILTETQLDVGLPIDQETVQHIAMLRARTLAGAKKIPKNYQEKEALRKKLVDIIRLPNFDIDTQKVKEIGLVQGYALKLSGLTVSMFFSINPEANTTQLLISDRGARNEQLPAAVVDQNHIFKADIFGTGENNYRHGYQLLVEAAGYRLLGIQVAQILACTKMAIAQSNVEKIDLAAYGVGTSTAALIAAALEPGLFNNLTVHGNLNSLKLLAEKPVNYEEAPSLFCFGLLEVVDIPQLLELLEDVHFHQPRRGLASF